MHIINLLEQGMSGRKAAAIVGCSEATVRATKSAQNKVEPQITHSESPNVFQEAEDFQNALSDVLSTNEDDAFTPFFDEDELDTTPAINPADAFNQALKEHEEQREEEQRAAERKETPATQDNSVLNSPIITTNGNTTTLKEKIKALLQASELYSEHTKAEVNAALFELSQGN